jgi:hypothetical protein
MNMAGGVSSEPPPPLHSSPPSSAVHVLALEEGAIYYTLFLTVVLHKDSISYLKSLLKVS